MDKIRITYLENKNLRQKSLINYLKKRLKYQRRVNNNLLNTLMKVKKIYNISDKEMTELIKANQEL